MNETLDIIHNRKSVRTFQDTPVDTETVNTIINTAMRAPTAGNMMLYSILEIEKQDLKDALAKSCDNQPFIAKAPLVLLFLADYQRWFDFFMASDVPAYCKAESIPLRYPGEGDLLLACCDALIAAQTAVIAAESLGVGSCYIGDIMEKYEYHRELLNLPQYTFPVALLCFGYPTHSASTRKLTPRLPQTAVHFKDAYQRLDKTALADIFAGPTPQTYYDNTTNLGQHIYARKFAADFTIEMTRSVKKAIQEWIKTQSS
ncbi:MAG: nitroreductase family protein [Anaerolineae bacterium]|nr:nitroreductase family protein [Anaerolineae bacterium]